MTSLERFSDDEIDITIAQMVKLEKIMTPFERDCLDRFRAEKACREIDATQRVAKAGSGVERDD